jgi:hypothetical protein
VITEFNFESRQREPDEAGNGDCCRAEHDERARAELTEEVPRTCSSERPRAEGEYRQAGCHDEALTAYDEEREYRAS